MSEKTTKKTTQTKTSKTTTKAKKAPVKKPVPKKENPLKKENELLTKKTFNLELQNAELKAQIQAANNTFLEKVETLQKDAKKQVETFREEHKENLEKEIAHVKKYAGSKFFTDFIEPLLNLELAIQAGKKQDDPGVNNYVIGFEMLLKQINDIMENNNVSKIQPKVGQEFNPETMTAIQVVENKEKADKVIEVKKSGYKMHNRVLKPASVVIGK